MIKGENVFFSFAGCEPTYYSKVNSIREQTLAIVTWKLPTQVLVNIDNRAVAAFANYIDPLPRLLERQKTIMSMLGR